MTKIIKGSTVNETYSAFSDIPNYVLFKYLKGQGALGLKLTEYSWLSLESGRPCVVNANQSFTKEPVRLVIKGYTVSLVQE